MHRVSSRRLLDLFAAAEAIGNDQRFCRRLTYCRQQHTLYGGLYER
jgi:hypothetical protein